MTPRRGSRFGQRPLYKRAFCSPSHAVDYAARDDIIFEVGQFYASLFGVEPRNRPGNADHRRLWHCRRSASRHVRRISLGNEQGREKEREKENAGEVRQVPDDPQLARSLVTGTASDVRKRGISDTLLRQAAESSSCQRSSAKSHRRGFSLHSCSTERFTAGCGQLPRPRPYPTLFS